MLYKGIFINLCAYDKHFFPEIRERWGAFAWTEASAAKAKDIIARYPPGRKASARYPSDSA